MHLFFSTPIWVSKIDNHEKKDFTLEVNKIDYYQTNIVARSSKTMRECKSIKLKNKKIEA